MHVLIIGQYDYNQPMETQNYVGRSILRTEDERLLRGAGSFTADIHLTGLLHLVIVRSPHAHAKILNIDASAVLNSPGVVGVLTSDDLHDIGWLGSIGRPGMEIKQGGDHPILASGRALYAGQPVAAVIAQSLSEAVDASYEFDITYEPLDAINDLEDAASGKYAPLHEAMGNNICAYQRTGGGDVNKAFNEAGKIISGKFTVPRIAPMAMEGRACISSYDSESGNLTFYSSNQSAHDIEHHLHEIIHVPGRIRVFAPDVGGGVGHKHHIYPEEVCAVAFSIKSGLPVKWVETRSENIHSSHSRGLEASLQAAVNSQGKILGLKGRFLSDMGAFWISGAFTSPDNAAKRITGPYDIKAYDGEQFCVMTNRPPMTSYRGAGQPEGTFCMERLMDLIARELDIDPIEVRRVNLIQPSSFPYTTIAGIPYVDGDYEPVIDKAVETSNYKDLLKKLHTERSAGKLVGLGVAISTKGSGGTGGDAARSSAAKISIDRDGGILIATDISPHGQGNATTFAQIAADILGVAIEDITVQWGDTDLIKPFGPGAGTYASRGLVIGGHAIHQTATQLRDSLLDIGARILETSIANVRITSGKLHSLQDPSHYLPIGQVACQLGDQFEGCEHYSTFTLPPGSFAFAMHVAYVEIDPETGRLNLKDFTAVHDVGNLINPMIVEGQIHGGIVQGLGEAMLEGISYADDGRPNEWSFMDYSMPLAEDIPHLKIETHATEARNGALGVRGIGEMPSVTAPVVLANAVHDALASIGAPMVEIPLSQEKIWHAVELAKREISD